MTTREDPDRRHPDRRRFLALGVGALVVASLPRALSIRRLVRRTVPIMGTIAELGVVEGDVARAEAAIDAALEELYRVDRTMTRFSRHSEVGRANLAAAAGAVALSEPTATVLAEALRWAEHTDGAFDPCLGEAMALWDVTHRHEPPLEREYRRFAGARLFRHLELERRGGTPAVHFASPEIALDLGGIAKGYAVDRAVDALRAHGIRDALVNVGGDLYAMGVSERGDPWRVGLQSPFRPGEIIAAFPVSDGAVATSGDYVRYFDYHGRRYHHLLDPATGEPRRTPCHSLTVAAATCMTADAAATALYGDSTRAGDRLLAGFAPGARVLHEV